MPLTGEWVIAGVGFALVMLVALTAATILGTVVMGADRRNRRGHRRRGVE